jgi:hypothetical protein
MTSQCASRSSSRHRAARHATSSIHCASPYDSERLTGFVRITGESGTMKHLHERPRNLDCGQSLRTGFGLRHARGGHYRSLLARGSDLAASYQVEREDDDPEEQTANDPAPWLARERAAVPVTQAQVETHPNARRDGDKNDLRNKSGHTAGIGVSALRSVPRDVWPLSLARVILLSTGSTNGSASSTDGLVTARSGGPRSPLPVLRDERGDALHVAPLTFCAPDVSRSSHIWTFVARLPTRFSHHELEGGTLSGLGVAKLSGG